MPSLNILKSNLLAAQKRLALLLKGELPVKKNSKAYVDLKISLSNKVKVNQQQIWDYGKGTIHKVTGKYNKAVHGSQMLVVSPFILYLINVRGEEVDILVNENIPNLIEFKTEIIYGKQMYKGE